MRSSRSKPLKPLPLDTIRWMRTRQLNNYDPDIVSIKNNILKPSQKAQLKRIFGIFDNSADGNIDLLELQQALLSYGYSKAKAKQYLQIFEALPSVQDDGEISFDEFVNVMSTSNTMSQPKMFYFLQDEMDCREDISAERFSNFSSNYERLQNKKGLSLGGEAGYEYFSKLFNGSYNVKVEKGFLARRRKSNRNTDDQEEEKGEEKDEDIEDPEKEEEQAQPEEKQDEGEEGEEEASSTDPALPRLPRASINAPFGRLFSTKKNQGAAVEKGPPDNGGAKGGTAPTKSPSTQKETKETRVGGRQGERENQQPHSFKRQAHCTEQCRAARQHEHSSVGECVGTRIKWAVQEGTPKQKDTRERQNGRCNVWVECAGVEYHHHASKDGGSDWVHVQKPKQAGEWWCGGGESDAVVVQSHQSIGEPGWRGKYQVDGNVGQQQQQQ